MKQRIIKTGIYLEDDWFNTLSIGYKFLFVYLFTNSHIGFSGIYELTDRVIRLETGFTQEELNKAKEALKGKVYFYKDWVCVLNANKHNSFTGKPNEEARNKELSLIPKEIIKHFNTLSIPYRYPNINININNNTERVVKREGKPKKELEEKEFNEVFDNPVDKADAEKERQVEEIERLKRFQLGLKAKGILVALFFFFVFPVHAETISLRYTVSSPLLRPAKVIKLIQAKDHSLPKKPLRPDQPSFGGSPTITPYPKFLTDKGAKTREKVLAQLSKYYSGEELTAADNILKKEAGYRYDAVNELGAGGIPQALPYTKMGCPLTEEGIECQADWFVGYVNRRYQGSPLKAWQHHLQVNWY